MASPAAAIAALWMGLVPGLWMACVPARGSADRITRLALAATFAPAFVAAWMTAGGALGIDPVVSALAAAASGLPALFLLRRRTEAGWPATAPAVAAAGVAIGLPLVWLCAHWLLVPEFRLFGRHNLMHSDMIYQLVRAPWPPESPELAGRPLDYGWFGHGFHAAIGLLADRPPTATFPWSNALSLAATVVLVARAAQRLGAPLAVAALASALALLTGHAVLDPSFWWETAVDDSKILAPITKFLFLDLMPASFPLLAAFLWAAVAGERRGALGSRAVGAAAALALAATYVAAVPAALCVSAGLLAAGIGVSRTVANPVRQHGPLLLAAAVALLAGMWWTPSGPAAPGVTWSPAIGWDEKGLDTLLGFGPWWLLALPAAGSAWKQGRPALAGLALAAGVLALAYPALLARNLEYKFVLYARLLIAPGIALTLCQWLPAGRAWVTSGLVALLVMGSSLPRGIARITQAHLESAVPIDEGAFHLRWDDPAQAGWLASLAGTPEDTVLVVRRCKVMLGALADRSLYAPCAADGRDIAGYTLWTPANLLLFRGHLQAVIQQRTATVAQLFRSTTRRRFEAALAEIRALGRPVALLFPAGDTLHPRWLAEAGIGRERHADTGFRLWWIPADAGSVDGFEAGARTR